MDRLFSWTRSRQSFPSSTRNRTNQWLTQCCRPRLEALEPRCLPSTVTNLDDNGPGSLRDALANTPADGTVDFQPDLTGTITLTSGSLTIDHSLSIVGPGANQLTLGGNDLFRVLNVFYGSNVAISDLTIAHGSAHWGGGLFNDGRLSLSRVVISQNNWDLDQDAHGAGILNAGVLTLTDCTINNNGQRYWPGGNGAGIYNSGSLTATRTTFTGNTTGVNSGHGGGAYNIGSMVLTSCTISQNTAASTGGGIDSESGVVSLMDCSVTQNTNDSQSPGGGAGIYNGTSMTIEKSTISGNGFYGVGNDNGGGIYNTGTLNVTGSSIIGNGSYVAWSEGGGIYNSGTAILTLCSISENHVADLGAGISSVGSTTLLDCTVADNVALEDGHIYQHGGGIAGVVTAIRSLIYRNGSAAYGGGVSGGGTYIDCTIANNHAFHAGGGIDGGGTFINCTITGNSAGSDTGDGGGGLRTLDSVVLKNTIVAGNSTEWNGTGPDILGTVTTATYNLIGDGTGCSGIVDGVDGNHVGSGSRPIDPRLGQLQDNGGPSWTEALLPDSPAIDAGNNGDTINGDQRGFNRIIGGTVDIGAYEYQPPATLTSVQSYPNPSTFGQPVVFRAQVVGSASNSNTPAGSVTFFDNGNVLRTVQLVNGMAAFATADLTVGSHTILAVYTGFSQGDYHFDASMSAPLDQEVLPPSGPSDVSSEYLPQLARVANFDAIPVTAVKAPAMENALYVVVATGITESSPLVSRHDANIAGLDYLFARAERSCDWQLSLDGAVVQDRLMAGSDGQDLN
jgi:hypothetical protein